MILWVLGIREIFRLFKASFLLLYLDPPSQICAPSLSVSCSLAAASAPGDSLTSPPFGDLVSSVAPVEGVGDTVCGLLIFLQHQNW